LEQILDRMDADLAQLAFDRDQLRIAKEAKELSPFESVVAVFSPLLLAFALGLRFAKVTGELRAEQPGR
jgi:hypothetical protein